MSATSKAFLSAVKSGRLDVQVQIARGTARYLIEEGGLRAVSERHDHVDELAGGPFDRERTDGDDETYTDYCHHIQAALALGIAIGQLVSPDVFKTHGVK
jgi:hypothetical protein